MAVTAQAVGTWTDLRGASFTVTIATPGVFTLNSHGLVAGDRIVFQTTGALPTGLTAGTVYYVISAGLTTNAFEVSTTGGGSAVATSGTQSGTHTVTQVEHILSAGINQAGSYSTHLDTTNMAQGDAIELRLYQILKTGGTPKVAYMYTVFGAQLPDTIIWVSPPISTEITDVNSVKWTIKQIAGTARAFDYKVLRYA